MNNHIRFEDVVKRFEEQKMPYEVLELGNDWRLVVTKYGAKVLGPFKGNEESLSWINQVFADKEAFGNFTEEKEWNLGGDRFWIAPEHPLFVKKRQEFFDSYCVQAALDPGDYTLSKQEDVVRTEQDVDMEVYESDIDRIQFHVARQVSALENPLVGFWQTKEIEVDFCGYEQEVTLEGINGLGELNLEPWNLLQVNPGGKIIVPFFGEFDFVNYYEPVRAGVMKQHDNFVEVEVDGIYRFKIAFQALHTFGRAIYVNKNESGYYLIYKQYYNDSANPYCCDPWNKPEEKGCSLYIYNDDGSNGGYAEFENSGLTIGKGTNKNKTTANVSHMFFAGDKEALEKVIKILLGITYKVDF